MEQRFIDLYNERRTDQLDHSALRSTVDGTERRMQSAALLLNLVADSRYDSVLDVGCGFGDLFRHLPPYFVSVQNYTGIDELDWVVGIAHRVRPGLDIRHCSLEACNVKADIVVALGVLATVPKPRCYEFMKNLLEHSNVGVLVSFLKTDEYVTDEGFYTYEIQDLCELVSPIMKLKGMAQPHGGITVLAYFEKA